MDKHREMTAELRRARGWILGVGLVMFGFGMIAIYGVNRDVLPEDVKARAAMILLGILAFFVAMFFVSWWRPVLACVLALCGFWALHVYFAAQDGASIVDAVVEGIFMKVLFTIALIQGIKSANRAERLKQELSRVFG